MHISPASQAGLWRGELAQLGERWLCKPEVTGSNPVFSTMNDMTNIKIIVEKHPDGYVAYPLGVKGVVVGQGDTYDEALADVKSAIRFHVDTFGEDVLEIDPPVLEAFVAETGIALSV